MVFVDQVKPQINLEEFLTQPATKPASEYINGKIIQKPMPQGQYSVLQSRLVMTINQFVLPTKLGYALPELRCTFAGVSIVPDISVFEWSRIPKNEKGQIANRFTIHPDWIIEILSPEQSTNQVIRKIIFCLKQGTQLGWLIDPQDTSVMTFQPDQLPDIQVGDHILPVLDVFPQLELSVTEIFSWLNIE